MIFLQPPWILAFVCAFVLYKAGDLEARDGARNNGVLWLGLSIATSAIVIHLFGGGWPLVLLSQFALFIGIGAIRELAAAGADT